MATKIEGGSNTAGLANVTTDYKLEVQSEIDATANPDKVPAFKLFSENDDGTITGETYLLSPETDDDYRLRISEDCILDTETFNYSAQNTGKHNFVNTTMTASFGTSGLTTNSGNITTTTTGLRLRTYAYFPVIGSAQTYIEFEAGFNQQPTTNTIIDFGLFIDSAANPYAPTDGAYFRLNASGLFGVINYNTQESTTSAFDFTYQENKKYQFLIITNERDTEFWINNVMYGRIETPTGQGQPFAAASLPLAVRHSIVGGAAGSALSFILNDYTVSLGGIGSGAIGDLANFGNRVYGSYQGLSGGTMGSLASYANSANPTAAVPTNTTSTVLTALGGQGWETDTLAANTDGIIMSYQNPAGSVTTQGRRIVIKGVKIDSYVQTVLSGGGYNAQFALCFGHTAVSLATSEAASTKAPRRIPLGSYSVASAAAALTQLPTIYVTFNNPVYVNPGEFIAISKKKVGSAPTSGVIAYTINIDFTFE